MSILNKAVILGFSIGILGMLTQGFGDVHQVHNLRTAGPIEKMFDDLTDQYSSLVSHSDELITISTDIESLSEQNPNNERLAEFDAKLGKQHLELESIAQSLDEQSSIAQSLDDEFSSASFLIAAPQTAEQTKQEFEEFQKAQQAKYAQKRKELAELQKMTQAEYAKKRAAFAAFQKAQQAKYAKKRAAFEAFQKAQQAKYAAKRKKEEEAQKVKGKLIIVDQEKENKDTKKKKVSSQKSIEEFQRENNVEKSIAKNQGNINKALADRDRMLLENQQKIDRLQKSRSEIKAIEKAIRDKNERDLEKCKKIVSLEKRKACKKEVSSRT